MEKTKTICHFCGKEISKNQIDNENYVFCEKCKMFSVKGNTKCKALKKKNN